MSDRYPSLPPMEPPEAPFDLSEFGEPLDLPEPTFWPDVPLADLADELASLRAWVEDLVRRYPHLDVHVVPPCWYRHPSHIEALVALRDHERVSFSITSPATSPAGWQVTLGQIEARLRVYTDSAGCLSAHREQISPLVPPSEDDWAAWVDAEVERSRQKSVEKSRVEPDPPPSYKDESKNRPISESHGIGMTSPEEDT